jgi:hypothetical protein
MIERFRVFGKGEKKDLAKALMIAHFFEFSKVNIGLKNMPYYYTNKAGDKICLDYKEDTLKYSAGIPEEKIWEFKDAYENRMARELIVGKMKKSNLFSLQDDY